MKTHYCQTASSSAVIKRRECDFKRRAGTSLFVYCSTKPAPTRRRTPPVMFTLGENSAWTAQLAVKLVTCSVVRDSTTYSAALKWCR